MTQKASVLPFMVNNLLQNKAVIGQIDGVIERQDTARRNRWIVYSKIVKLKTQRSKKHRNSLLPSMNSSVLVYSIGRCCTVIQFGRYTQEKMFELMKSKVFLG